MAMSLRYLIQSPKFLKTVFSDSSKQLQYSSLVNNFSMTQKVFCVKFSNEDIKVDEELSDSSDLIVNEPQNLILSNSNEFGNLRTPLEKKWKTKQQILPSQIQKLPNQKHRRSSASQFKISSNAQDSSDQFGNLTDDSVWYAEIEKPELGGENITFYPGDKKYRSPEAYLKEMKRLVKENKVKEALELFPDMKRNNVPIIHANYTFMIGACGRVGYTEMAFNLLRKMMQKNMRPTPATLTGLFNSCAECPFPEYGLKKIKILKEKISERNWLMTKPSYRALIKAYGRCGDLLSAFQTVDDMIEAGIHPDISTYNFLLMSCISDKEAGFTHALEVWRKLIKKKLIPDEYTFNLLLRATRDCGIGPQETSDLLLQHWSSYIKRPYGLTQSETALLDDMLRLPNPQFPLIDENAMKQLTAGSDSSMSSENTSKLNSQEEDMEPKKYVYKTDQNTSSDEITMLSPNDVITHDKPVVLTNLLSTRPVGGPVFTDLINIRNSSDRLALIGNAEGFLETMVKYKAKPDIKTFMLLLESSPPGLEIEEQLLALMDSYKVKPDTDFFNIIIKRRNFRKEFTAAKQVLCLIHKYNLSPDIVTFGVLAIGCHDRKSGQQLLREMKQLGYHPNIEIMDTLINKACETNDLDYIEEILQSMKYQSIKPNETLLKRLETKLEDLRNLVIDKEQGKIAPDWMTDKMCKRYYKFCNYYTNWLHDTKVDLEPHPWDQYKTDINVKDPNNIPMPLM